MKKMLLFVLMWTMTTAAQAQKADDILMTVGDIPVTVGEFKYIYEKSNGKEADYSRESLEKYLQLYTDFKLKIARAREMKLDTLPSLKAELEGYRKKLANAYLIDKAVADKLAREAYNRMKQDVRISHIFFSTKNLRSPADTALIYKKAMSAKARLEKGESFEELAKVLSEDETSKDKGGDIGYYRAIFPPGFYQLEEAAYSTPVGKIAGPVRSRSGYHIIKVTDKRPARGEMEIEQILFRKSKSKPDSLVRAQAERTLYAIQKAKMPFEEAAKKFSEDRTTGVKGGYVGFVGINRFEEGFEDAIFSLKNDGDISGIIESSIGFHIVKRLRKKELKDYKKEKRGILTKLRKDPRYQLAINAFIENTKKEAGFKEYPDAYKKWVASLPDSTFLTYKWKVPTHKDQTVLFSLGDKKLTIRDMNEYAYQATRQRLLAAKRQKLPAVAKALYNDFVREQLMSYAEARLEEKYPDFKALMREYEEGILLFEISKREVWDKASKDTTGLAEFYPSIQNEFQWEERAKVVTYTIPKQYEKLLPKLRKCARKKSYKKVIRKFNKKKPIVSFERGIYEKSKAPDDVKKVWRRRGITPTVFDVKRNPATASFKVVTEILPPRPKKLSEARGYAVAKYQDYLEDRWVKNLRLKYQVKVNQDVLDSLVKK